MEIDGKVAETVFACYLWVILGMGQKVSPSIRPQILDD